MPTPPRSFVRALALLATLLSLAVFVADLRIGPGYAIGLLYVVPVLLGLWAPSSWHCCAAAVLSTLLLVVATVLDPGQPHDLANAGLSLLAVLATGLAVHAKLRADARRIQDARRHEAALHEQEALVRLGEMAAIVAHEVKNPLTGIANTLEIVAPRVGEAERAVLLKVRDRVDVLSATIRDLLLFARPAVAHPREVHSLELLHEVVEQVGRDPDYAGVQLRIGGEDVVLEADPELIRGALVNLAINAAQAMDGHGVVEMESAREGRRCRLRVRDHGPGIPKALHEQIFQPFFTTRARGTGLGLAIVRRTAEAHRGQVEVASPADGGAAISLLLPA